MITNFFRQLPSQKCDYPRVWDWLIFDGEMEIEKPPTPQKQVMMI